MKKLLILSLTPLLFACARNESKTTDLSNSTTSSNTTDSKNNSLIDKTSQTIGIPKKIADMEVAENAFPNLMNWDDAMAACKSLGEGWRLPTKDELNKIYNNKEKIGGFTLINKGKFDGLTLNQYWSSTESDFGGAWGQYVDGESSGNQIRNHKSKLNSVLAVRGPAIKQLLLPIIGNSIRLGNIEIAEHDFPNAMNWFDASEACSKIGDGWRLPTKTELKIMCKYYSQIGGFSEGSLYWTSTEYRDVNYHGMVGLWVHDGYGKEVTPVEEDMTNSVRAVRSIDSK